MRMVRVKGKTVEEAVSAGLRMLNVTRDRAEVVVKVAPTKGLFGIGARNAELEITVIEDPVGDAERFLREMFVTMHMAVRVVPSVDGTDVVFELRGDRVGLLIGKHGQTLDAIQYLVNAVGNKNTEKRYHFIVDAEGYRERRRQALLYKAQKMAEKALHLGQEVVLEPMAAHDRKVIHIALQGRQDVRTESRGSEPDRAIVIVPATAKRSSRRHDSRSTTRLRQQAK